tara:strand:- start:3468 stop:5381 length:1914 start_codon:yes stop_codon:yes gene_type:complete
MSLKNILTGLGRKILGKKESALPATGQQQKQITYTPKPSQAQGQELAKQEIKNPPVVLKKTKPLQMGDDMAPGFGSSTYDWVMRKGRGKYTPDEWIDHLTSTRKVNFKIFGKPAQKTVRDQKRFKYDSGPFAGKEVNVSKEELFDSNLAIFNETGDLTGGLLYAAQKFGLKLDANEVGAMLKLNPINRLKPIELGIQKGAKEKMEVAVKNLDSKIKDLRVKFREDSDLVQNLNDSEYHLGAIKKGEMGQGAFKDLRDALRRAKARPDVNATEKTALNKLEADLNNAAGPLRNNRTQYANESNYTLQGGKDYRETIFTLPEDIATNSTMRNRGGHFTEAVGDTNNIYHIRYDTRFTPEGKKVFMINEIQSDVNQKIAKSLTKAEQLGGESRLNPFNADLELNLLINQRGKMLDNLNKAIDEQNFGSVNAIKKSLDDVNKKLSRLSTRDRTYDSKVKDYFPMVEADSYGDHAVKYLLQKAAKENVDFVAVAPFDKLSFRQGYKAGNERFYGYANGKGIGKKGKAVLPDVMGKIARFYNTKAGSTKISLSDPSKPYKKIKTDSFSYPKADGTQGRAINSKYHSDASATKEEGYKFIEASNPNLYFDAFAIKVSPLMRNTQKTYKSKGGLVVDIFKPIRYN